MIVKRWVLGSSPIIYGTVQFEMKRWVPKTLRPLSSYAISIPSVLLEKQKDYLKLNPSIDIEATHLLHSLLSKPPVIIPDNDYKDERVHSTDSESIISDIFKAVRGLKRSIFVSDSDKFLEALSTFFIMRLFNSPSLLAPAYYGSMEPPKVIISQNGIDRMTLMFRDDRIAHTIDCREDIFSILDRETSFYMFHTAASHFHEPFRENVDIPTLSLVHMDNLGIAESDGFPSSLFDEEEMRSMLGCSENEPLLKKTVEGWKAHLASGK
jgi:hypothetical protein